MSHSFHRSGCLRVAVLIAIGCFCSSALGQQHRQQNQQQFRRAAPHDYRGTGFQPTANWGTMPNGWAGYSLMQGGGFHGQQRHAGRYPIHGNHGINRGFNHSFNGGFNNGFVGGYRYGWGSPGFGFSNFYGCQLCGSPFCNGLFCAGNFVSGLSLTVVAPQVVQFPIVAPILVAPQPIIQQPIIRQPIIQQPIPPRRAAAVGEPGLNGNRLDELVALDNQTGLPSQTGLPWLDRLQRQQAAAFGARDAVAAENRNAAFEQRVEILTAQQTDARDRADQLVVQADQMFADGNYERARDRYELARRQSTGYPKVLFRLGQVSIALREYPDALQYFLSGLDSTADIATEGIELADLYGSDALAKLSHLQQLTEAALQSDGDGELTMLVGLMLHFDGQPERANRFFRKSATQPGRQMEYARQLATGPADNQPASIRR